MNKQMYKSNFIDVFGDYPNVRMIDFLLEHPEKKHTLAEIVEATNADNPNAYALMSKLVFKKYVIEENLGYRINPENPIIKQLLELSWDNHKELSPE